MKNGISLVRAFVAVLSVCGVAQAAQGIDPVLPDKVELSVERSVHMAGVPGAVKFTLTNKSAGTIHLSSPAPFKILKGNKVVYAPITIMVIWSVPLAPGESKSWSWDKKMFSGKWAPHGTYTIKVGPIFAPVATTTNHRSIDIALTPTGTLAGSNRFPLSVQNEWSFRSSFEITPAFMKVTTKKGSWFMVQNLLGGNRWVRMHSTQNALYTSPTPSVMLHGLFRFGLSPGSSYLVNVAGMGKLTVGSTNETVATPAGTFQNCYRLDVEYPPIALVSQGYKSFSFAPGVGLVQYVTFSPVGIVTYRLRHAKIRAFNGTMYRIGQK